MTDNTRKQTAIYLAAVAAIVAVAAVGIVLWKPWANKTIDTFQACKDAGGALLESYPEQCKIDGKSFTNDAQSTSNTPTDTYINLPEQEALNKAKLEQKAARVVERNGEPLPVTMDYAPGRLNMYVKDGKVYKIQVEGADS